MEKFPLGEASSRRNFCFKKKLSKQHRVPMERLAAMLIHQQPSLAPLKLVQVEGVCRRTPGGGGADGARLLAPRRATRIRPKTKPNQIKSKPNQITRINQSIVTPHDTTGSRPARRALRALRCGRGRDEPVAARPRRPLQIGALRGLWWLAGLGGGTGAIRRRRENRSCAMVGTNARATATQSTPPPSAA